MSDLEIQKSQDEQNLSEILRRMTPQRAIEVALEAVKKANQERDVVKAEAKESIEKARTFDRISSTNKWLSMSEAAKNLAFKNVGPIILESILRAQGIFMNTNRRWNQPYERHVQAGYFKLIQSRWHYPNGDEGIPHLTPYVSEKGLDFLRRLLEELGYGDTES